MGQVGIVTPVSDGHAHELKRYLCTELPRDQPPTENGPTDTQTSPFTGVLPPTHFARFVVIDLEERAHLFFPSRFDGPPREYLRALATTPQALTIWSHCQLAVTGETLTAAELDRYLCDETNWSAAQYVVSALPPEVTVAEVNRALSLRTDLARFVTHASRLEPAALAHAFRQLPPIRGLLR
ncbi:MAG: hypothetical protein ACXVE2_03605 [Solirubrobacteraceae bacterium]